MKQDKIKMIRDLGIVLGDADLESAIKLLKHEQERRRLLKEDN